MVRSSLAPDIADAIDGAFASLGDTLEAKWRAFAERVFAAGIEKYCRRIDQYGFSGLGSVLDAGCGFGQWSLALARANRMVDAIDVSSLRIRFLRELVSQLAVGNLRTEVGSLDRLPYESEKFGAVFCYGVVYLTPWRESLAEFARVLAPGGRLYVNANGFGWYKFLWYTAHNRGEGYEPREVAAKALLNTFRYHRGELIEPGVDILIEPEELTRELQRHGLKVDELAMEGTANLQHFKGPTEPPFFIGEYRGDRGVYEILATKSK